MLFAPLALQAQSAGLKLADEKISVENLRVENTSHNGC